MTKEQFYCDFDEVLPCEYVTNVTSFTNFMLTLLPLNEAPCRTDGRTLSVIWQ